MIEFREEIELIKHSINSMNARMDAFVDQINNTKQILYSHADKSIKEMELQNDRQYERLMKSINDIEEFESLRDDFRENSDVIKKLKKELNDNFKLKDEIKKNSSRLDEIEGYFEKYNLEIVLKEIDKLEKEYQKKVSEVLSSISVKKSKK